MIKTLISNLVKFLKNRIVGQKTSEHKIVVVGDVTITITNNNK